MYFFGTTFFFFFLNQNQYANPANCKATEAQEQILRKGKDKWWTAERGEWRDRGTIALPNGSPTRLDKDSLKLKLGTACLPMASSYLSSLVVPRLDCTWETPSAPREGIRTTSTYGLLLSKPSVSLLEGNLPLPIERVAPCTFTESAVWMHLEILRLSSNLRTA